MSSHHRVLFASIALAGFLAGQPVLAQTYISAEPIPSREIVGTANLTKILNLGYADLELWSRRLLNNCHMVQNVIDALSSNGAISTLAPPNTRYLVAAGGFEAVTDPSFVVTIQDTGPLAASASDIFVLDNALGYVQNQGGTAQFSLPFNRKNPFESALDYAVVTFGGTLTGKQAKRFFDHLGTIDPKLWSGTGAGFTQVNISNSPVMNYLNNNSMLFLIGAVPLHEFIQGLSTAASTYPNAKYSPIASNGNLTTAKVGAAFPGNDWIAFPGGEGYLKNLGQPSQRLLRALAVLRRQHLHAVANLLNAIDKANVTRYLNSGFKCPQN
jgi:hypothetical protein